MSIISTEEQNNQALISALSAHNSQPPAPALTFQPTPPSCAATDSSTTDNQSTNTNIATLTQAYLATTIKIKRILIR